MTIAIEKYFRPKNLKELFDNIKEHNASIIGGGITFSLSKSSKKINAIDLEYLGLNRIKTYKSKVVLDSCVSMGDILRDEYLRKFRNGIFPEALNGVANTPLRNLITVGGNIAQLFYWSTLPVVFFALDSKIELHSSKGKRILSSDEFFQKQPRLIMEKDEIVTSVIIPTPGKNEGVAYKKFEVTENSYAMIQVAVDIKVFGKKIKSSRIVLGSITQLPQRCVEAEIFLTGKPCTADVFSEAGQIALKDVKIRKDFRASKEFRQEVASVLVRRALEEACKNLE